MRANFLGVLSVKPLGVLPEVLGDSIKPLVRGMGRCTPVGLAQLPRSWALLETSRAVFLYKHQWVGG